MNESLNNFSKNLKQRIVKMESQLQTMLIDIDLDQKAELNLIGSKIKNAKDNAKTIKKDFLVAEKRASNWLKAKEKAGAGVIKGWKSRLEKNKLESHAKSAEDNAEAAVEFAEAKIADAVLATYEAIEARMAASAPKK